MYQLYIKVNKVFESLFKSYKFESFNLLRT